MVEPTLVEVIFPFLAHGNFYHIILPMVSNNKTHLSEKHSTPFLTNLLSSQKAGTWQLQLADD
jgi:hypothetical protein